MSPATQPLVIPAPRPETGEDPGHAAWCLHHGAQGCLGPAIHLPGTRITVWLSALTANDPRLVVDGPGGVVEVPVEP